MIKKYEKEVMMTISTQGKHCENMCDGLTTYYTNGVSCLIYNEDLVIENDFTYLRCSACLNDKERTKTMKSYKSYEFKTKLENVDVKRIFEENKNDNSNAFIVIFPKNVLICIKEEILRKFSENDQFELLWYDGYDRQIRRNPLHWGNRSGSIHFDSTTGRIEKSFCLTEASVAPNNYEYAYVLNIPKKDIKQMISQINEMFDFLNKKYSKKHKIKVLTWSKENENQTN